MATPLRAGSESEWVRVCREHNAICLIVGADDAGAFAPPRVVCPFDNGHVLMLDMQWKVCRRGRPAAHGWNGWNAGEGEEA